MVLLANPAKFCNDFDAKGGDRGGSMGDLDSSFLGKFDQPSPALLAKFGLTLPPPSDLGPDRRANLLPVLVLLERHPLKGCQAVLVKRRTGYLLRELDQKRAEEADGGPNQSQEAPALSKLGAFMI